MIPVTACQWSHVYTDIILVDKLRADPLNEYDCTRQSEMLEKKLCDSLLKAICHTLGQIKPVNFIKKKKKKKNSV